MLWTPNPKTIEPVHLCPVCGGIDRKHHPAATRDARRYFSFHRVCCCGDDLGGTPTTSCSDFCLRIILQVNSFCCFWENNVAKHSKLTSVSNGTYEITPTLIAGTTWSLSPTVLVANGMAWDRFGNFSDTTCSSYFSSTTSDIKIVVGGNCSGSTFTIGSVTISNNLGAGGPQVGLLKNSGTFSEGEYIPNADSCTTYPYAGSWFQTTDSATVRFDRIVCGSL